MKLNLRSIDLNLLPVFEAVMESGQLSKAAQNIGMSQPAMSAAVQRLRDTFSDQLFIRTRKGVQATPRANDIYSQLQPLLEQMRTSLSSSSSFDPASCQDSFRIHSGDYFEFVILPVLVRRIQTLAPGVSIQATSFSASSSKQLLKGEADVVLDAFPLEESQIIQDVIHNEELVVIAREGHPEIKGSNITIEDFFNAQHVALTDDERALPLDMLLGKDFAKKRKIGVQVSQFSSLLVTASQTDFIASVPSALAWLYADKLGFKIYKWPFSPMPLPVYLMRPALLKQDPAHLWFVNEVKQACVEVLEGFEKQPIK